MVPAGINIGLGAAASPPPPPEFPLLLEEALLEGLPELSLPAGLFESVVVAELPASFAGGFEVQASMVNVR